jgi:hypothetical protein
MLTNMILVVMSCLAVSVFRLLPAGGEGGDVKGSYKCAVRVAFGSVTSENTYRLYSIPHDDWHICMEGGGGIFTVSSLW